jgi:molybdate transport system substrate-binding protein
MVSSVMRRLRALVLCAATAWGAAAQAGEVTVSAAASLSNALRDIAPLFEAAYPGTKVLFNVGASGALLAQIAKGAPVDVFASADTLRMDQAQAQKLIQPASRRNVARNELVLITPLHATRQPGSLAELTQPAYTRIAIGLPASVPVGTYTQAVLEAANLWGAIQPKMVGAHSVRQALDYVARAEVDAGFVYATDAAMMPGKVKVAFTVPTTTPILYPVAALAAAPNPASATRFVEFLVSPAARAVFARHGFGKP